MSLVGGTVQTVFAALSFAGAGYLFQHLNKSGYESEMKRHNKALEQLAKAKESFYENEVKNHDRIQQLRQKIADARDDIDSTNDALDRLRRIRTIQFNGLSFESEPKMEDFYKPSQEMTKYQNIAAGAIGIPIGYLAYHFLA